MRGLACVHPPDVAGPWGGQREKEEMAAADRCMSVLLHAARTAVQHLPPALERSCSHLKYGVFAGNGALKTM